MKPTPSALKWLVEKRARVANDALQTARMVEELTERREKLQRQLAALDETIRLYDQAIDPTGIAPVNAWQGRFGKRGALRDALIDVLAAQSPAWVASDNIERHLIARFGIGFEGSAHRKRWRMNSLCPALNRLLKAGTAERLHDPSERTGKHGYWRLKQTTPPSLADL